MAVLKKKLEDQDDEQAIALALEFYPWQEQQKVFLFNLANQDHLHHAFLFHGPAHLGKFNFACAMSALLLCEHHSKNELGVACQHCHACHLVRSMTHPDLYVLKPEKEGKQILVDEVRQLIDFMSKSSARNGRRMVIIDQCHQMNSNAANALLKFLEEPGEHVHLFLVSSELNALLPTIRSRCQKLSFIEPSEAQALAWLKQYIDSEVESSLLEYAALSPLLALQLRDDPIFVNRKSILLALKSLLQNKVGAMAYAEQWSDYSLILFLSWWHACLGDVLKLLAGADIEQLRFKSLYAELEIFAGSVHQDNLLDFMDEIFLLRQQLNRGAPFTQTLVLQSLLLQWQDLAK